MMGACAIAGVLGWGTSTLVVFVTYFDSHSRDTGINVALSFCMGTDIAGIMSNPIGQPMATVRRTSLSVR